MLASSSTRRLARRIGVLSVPLLVVLACKKDPPPPSKSDSGPTTAAPSASAPDPFAAAFANEKPVDAGFDGAIAATNAFYEAALAKPMRIALMERCDASERASSLGKMSLDDARILSRACDRVFAVRERITLNESVAATCTPQLAEKTAARILDPSIALADFRGTLELSGCKGLVTGKQAIGASCGDDAQCAAGLTCQGLSLEDDGTCQPRGRAGEPCKESFSLDLGLERGPCASGLGCVNGVCRPLAAAGAPCERHSACATQHCFLNGKSAGTCAALRPIGGACGDESDCLSHLCRDGKCVERGKAGAKCSKIGECVGVCDVTAQVCKAFCGNG